MDIERETIVEAGVSAAAVAVFILAVVVVGSRYSSDGDITGTGGLAILAAMALFVFVMTGVGLYFASMED